MLPFTQALASRRTKEWLASSILDGYADSYVQTLADRGYKPGTIRSYLSSVAHLAHWCQRRQLGLSQIDEALVERFIDRHLPACRCAIRCARLRHTVRAALAQLVEGLRSSGHIALRPLITPSRIDVELRKLDLYLRDVRGLSDLTRQLYQRHLRSLLPELFAQQPIRISRLEPKDIAAAVRRCTVGYKPASIKSVNIALRCYFAFKTLQGEQTAHLTAALPRVVLWRLSNLPKMLPSQDVDRLLRSCDRTTATGKRDYAIARCFVDLGLRRAEVARLQLDDVDWREGVLRIAAKGRRTDVLPLPSVTGHAIVDYLRHGRPKTTRREIFVRHAAPHDRPAALDLPRSAIRCAASRCGLQDRVQGTHILRHTVAGRLVQSGAPLKQIADLLRHRDLDTTTIYAKVDLPTLSRVAMPWPGRGA